MDSKDKKIKDLQNKLNEYENDKANRVNTYKFAGGAILRLFIGKKLNRSIDHFILESRDGSLTNETLSNLMYAVVRRIIRISIISIALAMIPSFLMFAQTLLMSNQNEIVRQQTELIKTQNIIAQSSVRSELRDLVESLISDIDEYVKDDFVDENSILKVPDNLVNRIIAVSHQLKPYKFLSGNKEVGPYSPERGLLFTYILSTNFNTLTKKQLMEYCNFEYAYVEGGNFLGKPSLNVMNRRIPEVYSNERSFEYIEALIEERVNVLDTKELEAFTEEGNRKSKDLDKELNNVELLKKFDEFIRVKRSGLYSDYNFFALYRNTSVAHQNFVINSFFGSVLEDAYPEDFLKFQFLDIEGYKLDHSFFNDCIFLYSKFTFGKFNDVTFSNSTFYGCDFDYTELREVNLVQNSFTLCDLNWKLNSSTIEGNTFCYNDGVLDDFHNSSEKGDILKKFRLNTYSILVAKWFAQDFVFFGRGTSTII